MGKTFRYTRRGCMKWHRKVLVLVIFLFLVTWYMQSGVSYGFYEIGEVSLQGKVRQVEGSFVVAGESIVRIEPVLANVAGQAAVGQEIKDIAIDEGSSTVYVLQEIEEEGERHFRGIEDEEEKTIIKAIEFNSSEVVATAEVNARAIESVPVEAAVVALGKNRKELLVLDSEVLSLRYKIEIGRKVFLIKSYPGSSKVVLVMERVRNEKRHHHRKHRGG